MDCKAAWLLMPFAKLHAPELGADEERALEQHLEGCAACATELANQREFDLSLGRAMRAVPLPEGLRERLTTRLDNERHRQQRSRLLYAVAALAAAILLGLLVQRWTAPVATPEAALSLHQLAQLPAPAAPPRKVENVGPWFQTHHALAVEVPADFARQWNFDLIQSAAVERVGKELIPVLVFRNEDAYAKVFLLQPGQYSGEEAAALLAQPYAGAPRVYGKPQANEAIALVVFSGEKSELQRFHQPVVLPRG